MATIKNYTGFNVLNDNSVPLRDFIGFSAETLENFTIRVIDNLSNLVEGATIEVTYGGNTSTYVTQTGSISLYIENPISSIKVEAYKDCLSGDPVFTSHGGDGFNVSVDVPIGELPCLEEDIVNNYNFIRWSLSNNLTLPLSLPLRTCTNCNNVDFENLEGVQRPLEDSTCSDLYQPIMIPNETYSFLTNFNDIISFNASTADVRVGFLKKGKGTLSDSYSASFDVFNSVNVFYAEFKLGSLEDGIYQMVLYNNNDNKIYLISNEIFVNSNARLKQTALLKYRNSDDIDGFTYTDLPNFYNKIRIDLYRNNARSYEPEVEQEDQVVTGNKRYISVSNRVNLPVVAEFLDDLACEALESFITHDEIYVNGKRYNSDAEIEYEQLDLQFNKFRCNFKLWDYEYARKNRYK